MKKCPQSRFLKLSLFIVVLSLLTSCSSRRKIEKTLYSGDYDQVIDLAVSKLKTGRDKPKKQDYIRFLEEAYEKAQQRDLKRIHYLKASNNRAYWGEVYEMYRHINDRQELIRPLLPLFLTEENRSASFKFWNFTKEIARAKDEMSDYYYQCASELLKIDGMPKLEYRRAYDDLTYVLRENRGFRNTEALMRELQVRGTIYIHVYTRNASQTVIPRRLENDLLNFSTWGLNDKWTVFHNKRNSSVRYDYAVILDFRTIDILPDNVREKEFLVEREIVVGEKIKKDDNGKELKDEYGNPVKEKIYKLVKASVLEVRQFKSCRMQAKIELLDLKSRQTIDSYPLEANFLFENRFARYRGDERALNNEYRKLLTRSELAFPTNEQMVYDCGEDLKQKLKTIISRLQFSDRR